MSFKYVPDTSGGGTTIADVFIFKGSIANAAAFPTLASVDIGWFYQVTANVTDNNPAKTNTGLSFLAGDEIAWNGTTWCTLGSTALFTRTGTTISPATANDSISIGSGSFLATGSLASTGSRILKGWFTDLECTNAMAGSITGNAGTVTNATLTTALTVNTGTLTLTASALNTSVLTIGAGAVSVSGANTGDVTLATNHGLSLTGQVLAMGTPSTCTAATTNAVTTTTHTHAVTGFLTAQNWQRNTTILSPTTAGDTVTIPLLDLKAVYTAGLTLENTTNSGDGTGGTSTIQYPPSIVQAGSAWDTDNAVSRSVSWRIGLRPVDGNTVTSVYYWRYSLDGGSYSDVMTLTSAGALSIIAGLSATTGAFSSTVASSIANTTTSSVTGVYTYASTNALVGVKVRISPFVGWVGRVWDETGTPSSKHVRFISECLPVNNSGAIGTAIWRLGYDYASSQSTSSFTGYYPLQVYSQGNVVWDTGATLSSGLLQTFKNNTTVKASLDYNGFLSLGSATAPTAALLLPAGTATASTAPLKFTSGTLLSSAEAGAVEFLTDKYYATITTGTARKEIQLYGTYFGEMYIYENATAETVNTNNVYKAVRNFSTGSVAGFTFGAGSTGAISAFADYGGTVTGTVLVTDVGHGLTTGMTVTILGTTNYNGTFVITKVSDDTFYITDTWVANDATGNWYCGSYLKANTGSAGTYRVSFNVTADSTSSGDQYKVEMNKNATALDNIASQRNFSSGTDYGQVTASGLVTVADGDYIWMSFKQVTSGTDDFLLYHANVNIIRI